MKNNFEYGIQQLKLTGLNIFLSARVSDLPDGLYPFTSEQKKKTLVLVGHGGKTLWENIPDFTTPDPVDTYSIKQMKSFASEVLKSEIEILFPDDKYLLPLQKLGRLLHFSHQSPLGFDISFEFGLWFAYRGVFLTESDFSENIQTPKLSPCDSCREKLCLSVSDIIDARMKCPVRTEHQYTLEQRIYHQSQAWALKTQFSR